MSWLTGTATDYKDLFNKLVAFATGNSVVTAAVSNGGTGYTVGDVLTATGGTFTFAATFEVLAVSSGVVTSLKIRTGGEYRDKPTNPVATTGGAGTGCTLNVTFIPYTGANEREAILQGVGSGSDTIYVGLKSYQQANGADTAFNWTLIGMTGFNSSLAFDAQAGVSPGAIPTSAGGAYVPLHNNPSFPISFWFSVTGRRIIGVAKIENAVVTHYASFHLGWLNPFGTSTEFPYPIYVSGSSARHDCLFNTTSPSITGLAEQVGISGKTGPGYIRLANSTWVTVRNSVAVDSGSPSRTVERNYVVYPAGQTSQSFLIADDVIVADGQLNWDEVIAPTGIPGTAALRLQATPNTGGDLHLLVPCTICLSASSADMDVWGEIDDVFWVSGAGGVSSEDTITSGSLKYRIFQCGNRTTEFSFMAILEN